MKIGIVGLGYVGLPLAVAFADVGCAVVGVDVDVGKVAALRAGRSHIEDIPDAALAGVLDSASSPRRPTPCGTSTRSSYAFQRRSRATGSQTSLRCSPPPTRWLG